MLPRFMISIMKPFLFSFALVFTVSSVKTVNAAETISQASNLTTVIEIPPADITMEIFQGFQYLKRFCPVRRMNLGFKMKDFGSVKQRAEMENIGKNIFGCRSTDLWNDMHYYSVCNMLFFRISTEEVADNGKCIYIQERAGSVLLFYFGKENGNPVCRKFHDFDSRQNLPQSLRTTAYQYGVFANNTSNRKYLVKDQVGLIGNIDSKAIIVTLRYHFFSDEMIDFVFTSTWEPFIFEWNDGRENILFYAADTPIFRLMEKQGDSCDNSDKNSESYSLPTLENAVFKYSGSEKSYVATANKIPEESIGSCNFKIKSTEPRIALCKQHIDGPYIYVASFELPQFPCNRTEDGIFCPFRKCKPLEQVDVGYLTGVKIVSDGNNNIMLRGKNFKSVSIKYIEASATSIISEDNANFILVHKNKIFSEDISRRIYGYIEMNTCIDEHGNVYKDCSVPHNLTATLFLSILNTHSMYMAPGICLQINRRTHCKYVVTFKDNVLKIALDALAGKIGFHAPLSVIDNQYIIHDNFVIAEIVGTDIFTSTLEPIHLNECEPDAFSKVLELAPGFFISLKIGEVNDFPGVCIPYSNHTNHVYKLLPVLAKSFKEEVLANANQNDKPSNENSKQKYNVDSARGLGTLIFYRDNAYYPEHLSLETFSESLAIGQDSALQKLYNDRVDNSFTDFMCLDDQVLQCKVYYPILWNNVTIARCYRGYGVVMYAYPSMPNAKIIKENGKRVPISEQPTLAEYMNPEYEYLSNDQTENSPSLLDSTACAEKLANAETVVLYIGPNGVTIYASNMLYNIAGPNLKCQKYKVRFEVQTNLSKVLHKTVWASKNCVPSQFCAEKM